MHRAHDLLAATLACACACLTATAHAAQPVSLHATLTPEHLGQGTTIGFDLQITAPAGQVPSPLTEVNIRYPGDLGIALSGLGLTTCTRNALAASGPEGCPANSRMGNGTALAEIPIGPEIVHETAHIAIFRTQDQHGHLALLFYADAANPLSAQIIIPGLLLATPPPYGGRINLDVPLIPSVPEAPNVAIVTLHATLGPQHITYYEHTQNHTLPYTPEGILLPNTCPHGGFPFAAKLTFQNTSHASAHTTVPCPPITASPRRIASAPRISRQGPIPRSTPQR